MLLSNVGCLLLNWYLCSEMILVLLGWGKYDVEFLNKNAVLFFVSCGILFKDEDEYMDDEGTVAFSSGVSTAEISPHRVR